LHGGRFFNLPQQVLPCSDRTLSNNFARSSEIVGPQNVSRKAAVEVQVVGQRLYLQGCQPEAKATIVIDYNDLSAPTSADLNIL
jgi:hypothetical protein